MSCLSRLLGANEPHISLYPHKKNMGGTTDAEETASIYLVDSYS